MDWLTPELMEVIKDAVSTIIIIVVGAAIGAAKNYYSAGRAKALAEVEAINDTSLRLAVRDAVLAVEQIAGNYFKEVGEKMASEDKLQAAVNYLEAKGFNVEIEDIEAMIAKIKENAKK